MNSDVTFSHNAASMLRVYINDTLHLAFSAEKMAGIQSWEMTTRSPPLFCIEITMSESELIVAEYSARELWVAILTAIDQALGAGGATNKRQVTRSEIGQDA